MKQDLDLMKQDLDFEKFLTAQQMNIKIIKHGIMHTILFTVHTFHWD